MYIGAKTVLWRYYTTYICRSRPAINTRPYSPLQVPESSTTIKCAVGRINDVCLLKFVCLFSKISLSYFTWEWARPRRVWPCTWCSLRHRELEQSPILLKLCKNLKSGIKYNCFKLFFSCSYWWTLRTHHRIYLLRTNFF